MPSPARPLTSLEIARNRLAAARRNGSPASVVDQRRAELAELVLRAKIGEVTAHAVLPADARARLASLILAGGATS
jgi:hypothetical protein